MLKKKKVVIGILCAILVPIAMVGIVKANFNQAADIGFNTFIAYWASKVPGMEVYELTEAEKKWLKAKFGDEERIEKGRLYESEAIELEKGRLGLSVLEEKYPGYHFYITWLNRLDSWSGFTVYEKTTGEKVTMNVEGNEESSYEVKDDFYEYFFADKYASYIKEQLEENGIDEITVRTGLFNETGKEYDINMSVEDIVSGRLEVWAVVFVDVYVDDMAEEDCVEYAQTIQKIIEKTNLYGSYHLYFKDVLKEEMLEAGEKGKEKYKYSFQFY